jgi:hypothetical protein
MTRLCLLALLSAYLALPGCGTSAIRAHAIAAHTDHVLVQTAGDSIETGTRAAVAACPDADGPERTACLDNVQHIASIAGQTRDALIVPTEAYRAVTLRACGVDPSTPNPTIPESCPDSPDLLTLIEAAAAPVVAELPILTNAIQALTALAGGH